LPTKNDYINQDWISDKSRFCIDSFFDSRQENKNIELSEILTFFTDHFSIKKNAVQFITGPHTSVEE
tara:strand:- start:2284 stop:2484 length:201 start_codon:yes stop_codon:yes gene_type:complete